MGTKITFEGFTFTGQQSTQSLGFNWDAPFPLGLKAAVASDQSPTLADSIEAIRDLAASGKLSQLVKKHGGAVLFRGLPISTPQEYSDVAHAFGFRAHEETANEGPSELPIWPHNEYGWSTINPAWLTFSALVPRESGGETPIISSIGLAAKIRSQAPEFYNRLLQKGVRYVYRYGRDSVISNTGASIFDAYGQHVLPTDDEQTIRKKIEAEVQRHSNVFEWNDDGSLSVTHHVPLIRIHKDTDLPTWFGNITSAWGRSTHHGATLPPFRGDDGSYHPPPEYGTGEQIEKKYLDLALFLAESLQVPVQWQKGDLVLLDNYAVMHSRSPWKGQRQILVALWDQDSRIDDYEEGKEILKSRPRVPIVVEG